MEQFGLEGPVDRWRGLRDTIHTEVCCRGFNADMGAFVQSYDTRLLESYDVDARRLVGNYRQAFSHVGLINTARNLSRAGGPSDDRRSS